MGFRIWSFGLRVVGLRYSRLELGLGFRAWGFKVLRLAGFWA